MKAALLHTLVFACSGLLLAAEPQNQTEIRPAVVADKTPQPLKPVRTYHDVLAVIPKDLEPESARHWSPAQKEVANGILTKKLVDSKRPATMRFKVHGVEFWSRMTVWSHLPADEGYSIRAFVGQWRDVNFLSKLATLKKGDLIEVSGSFEHVLFENLWNTPSLSITLRDAVFTKLLPNGKPAPKPDKINVGIISAVYGSGNKFADVTDRVKTLLNEPGAAFTAQPHWLGADPTPYWNKALIIVHETGGKRRIFTTGEGGNVSAELLAR